MGLRRGFQAVAEAKQEQDSRGGGGGYRFVILGGETAVLRFIGDFLSEQDPVICLQHYVKRLKQKPYHNCGKNAEPEQPCVFCYLRENRDKGISESQRALFYVNDKRKKHKLDAEVRQLKPGKVAIPGKPTPPDAFEMTKYPWCRGKNCEFCRMGNEAITGGHRYWELALQFADQLVSQQNTLRDYCRCGSRDEEGGGTISVTQYLCGNADCGAVVDFDPNAGFPMAQCATCGQTNAPLEEIACSACEEPCRCTLQDFLFKVSRSGSGSDTSYNFEAIHPCKPMTEEEIAEAEKYKPNWEELTQPQPPELQAQALAIPNPFGPTPGHGARPYGAAGTAAGPKAPAPAPKTTPPVRGSSAPKPPVARGGGIKLPGKSPSPPPRIAGKPTIKLGGIRKPAPAVTEEEEIVY